MTEIRFEHVTKIYSDAEEASVIDVSFKVDPGGFVVLLGPSGCGKTTLLKIVNRLHDPTSGSIFMDGVDTRQIPLTELRRQIGYVIQQVGLFPHMTVAKNIAVVPELLEWSKSKIEARVDELLSLIGMEPASYRDRYPAQLSGGQQQRVGLARALAADPKVMLMDEPFGAIDAINRECLQDEMLDLQRKLHKTILFVTHDVDEALKLADKIVVMREGRLVQYAQPCNLLTKPADEFVRSLVNADDRIRQLTILKAAAVMEGIPAGGIPAGSPVIQAGTDLRSALSVLLQPEVSGTVVKSGEKIVGWLSLATIQRAGCGLGEIE